MKAKIFSLLVLVSITFGMSSQLGASSTGNVPEYIMPAGHALSIDLDYLFGVGHGEVRIYHAEGKFDYTIYAGASTFIRYNLTPDDSGVVIIEEKNADGNVVDTYSFRLTVVESLEGNGINQILNVFSYEK